MIVPDYIGRVAGFREWKVYADMWGDYHMGALMKDTEWEMGPQRFKCMCKMQPLDPPNTHPKDLAFRPAIPRSYHKEIDYDNFCGFYAYDEVIDSSVMWRQRGYAPGNLQMLTVPGVSSHWGKIIVYEDGLRSEYAQIEAVFAPWHKYGVYLNTRKNIMDWLEEKNIPIIQPGDFIKFIEEKGLINPWDIKYPITSEE